MGAIPYAFSVHHFISTVGADAGFAAIIGLALLVLLYFAQARETASLRDWAADSAERVQQLEARLAQLTRAQASSPATSSGLTSPPAPPPPGIARAAGGPAAAAWAGAGSPVRSRAAVSSPGAVAALAPAAPAGVGAPALSAATRLIPSSDRDQISIRARGTSGIASTEPPARAGGAAVMAPTGPPPATAAGGGNGSGPPRVPAPASAAPLAAQSSTRPGVRRGDASGAPRPGGSVPRRPVGPSRSGSPGGGRPPVRRGFVVLLGLLGLIAVVVVVLVVTSSGGSSTTPPASNASGTASAKTGHHRRAAGATPVKPSSVTVAVLNGTSKTNLAHTTAARLTAVGYKEGTVATASDQTHATTVVGYFPHYRGAALIVAQSLKLGPASVQPVDQSSQTVACPATSTPCTAQVVVTVGSDLASKP